MSDEELSRGFPASGDELLPNASVPAADEVAADPPKPTLAIDVTVAPKLVWPTSRTPFL